MPGTGRRGGAIATAMVVAIVAMGLPTRPAASQPPGGSPRRDVRREIVGERTAASQTFRNADGSSTKVLHASPIHYRSGGRWLPISSDLVPADAPYAWRNEGNSFSTLFKRTLLDGYLRFEAGGVAFSVALEDASPARATTTASPSRLTYRGAFPGVDVQYDVISDGVKETLVLSNPAARSRYRFVLTPEDGARVQAHRQDDGSWAFFGGARGEPVLILNAPFAFDSSETASKARYATMRVEERSGEFLVDVAVDERWLADPEREFPVYLDPTMTIQPTAIDATFRAGCGECPPYVHSLLHMGTNTAEAYRAGLLFDLGDPPTMADVTGAQLKLRFDRHCVYGPGTTVSDYDPQMPRNPCAVATHTLDVHRMTNAWSTSSTSSQIAFEPLPLSSYTLVINSRSPWREWMTWDVLPAVRAWIAGTQPNYGFLVKRSTEPPGAGGPQAGSRTWSDAGGTPTLEITYVSDAVSLYPPDTLHADGAELEWTRYSGAAPFSGYDVHRSATVGFTPTASTLLATVSDIGQTSFRDVTAAPENPFTYKVVAGGSVSNGERVTLPPDGHATKLLQPDAPRGTATEMRNMPDACASGTESAIGVGTMGSTGGRPPTRTLVKFDLGDVPTGSAVSDAKLSLWETAPPRAPLTVDLHRVTRAWNEGGAQCETSWPSARAGIPWTDPGGDFAAAPSASIDMAGREVPRWDAFDVTGLVQQWVGGDSPNLGVIFKSRTEDPDVAAGVDFASDDYASAALRPKLAVSYRDGSHARGPGVEIASPGPGAAVSGSRVVGVTASDDRRVEAVEVFRDGVSIGVDDSAPYEVTWATSGTSNGSHVLTATARDDAGNVTTSPATTVTVQNSAPPVTSLSAPAAGATVKGTAVSVAATATDDAGVERVEFFFDGNRIGAADTTSPYGVTWNTLDATQPAFDGLHELTARAYDGHGQMTIAAARNVTVANAAATKYLATYASTAVPQAMPYDPAATTQQNQPVDVTVTNRSTVKWSATDMVLRYRWLRPDGSVAATGTDSALTTQVAAGASRTLRADVVPPVLPDGVDKAQFVLRLEMFEKSTSSFFSAKGTKPLDNPVVVNKVLKATALGIERYYHYDPLPVGAGMTQMTNVANGNSLLRWTPFSAPGRGLATVVDLTYNSLEDKSESQVGNNFSLGVSSLTRLGLPLDIHPNKADELAGRATKYIQLTDSDGTTHRFTQNSSGGWDEPPGVHLYLRQYSTTDLTRKWALTRPDRTTFFYDDAGFPTAVQDRNGNTISFAYEAIPAGDDPGGVKKRVTTITDAAGQGASAASNRRFTLDYYTRNEAKKPQIRGKVESIKDHNGSMVLFDYYEDGNLLRLTQKGGTTADGSYLPDRSFVFTYTTSAGDGPAIPTAAARATPDPQTSPQSTRLFSVRDPRGAETTFAYFGSTAGQDRWKLRTRTDRSARVTSFAYDNAATLTSVVAPSSRLTKYDYDSNGMVVAIVDAKNRKTEVAWSTDRHVTKVTEPTGAFVEFAYNANGYLTDRWDQLRRHLQLTYENVQIDANDVATKWKAGRQIPHLSQLKSTTDARGSVWSYGYDTNGNVKTVTQPEGAPAFQTAYVYNADGTVASVTDGAGNVTTIASYDANGLPTKVVDAESGTTTLGYDDDGLLRWIQDANHASYTGGDPRRYRSYFDYDSFHRLGRQSAPKMTSENAPLIWSSAELDANDNVVKEWAPEEGYEFTRGEASKTTYDAMDRRTSATNADDETTEYAYDAAGRLERLTPPKGSVIPGSDKDYATFFTYDELDRVVRRTRYETDSGGAVVKSLHEHYCYDLAGDLRRVTGPRAAVDTVDCAAASPPPYTTTYEYDAAHQLKSTVDPLGHRTSVAYDANGNVETSTDADGTVVTRSYDRRNLLTKVTQPFVKGAQGRDVVTRYVYDGAGNVSRTISPRAWDASTDKQTFVNYVTKYEYDGLNRPVTVTLPSDQRDPAPLYVHNAYDAVGNLRWTSLPTTATSPGAVAEDKKTTMTYFDTGWVKTSHDPGTHAQNPKVAYDYWPEGWQKSRTPEGGSTEQWTYDPDGTLREHFDRLGQKVVYEYDQHNLLVGAKDSSGLIDPTQKAVEVGAFYDTLDRVSKTRHRIEGVANWTFATFDYDLGSNVIERGSDGEETPTGTVVTDPRRATFTYDAADRLDLQSDFGKPGVASDDMTIDNAFTSTGWEKERIVKRGDGAARQTTQWTYFANGALKTLVVRGGGPTDPVVEQHAIDYLDDQGIYVNGHRTKDTFFRKGPNAAAPCRTAECTERFVYDARDKLVSHRDGRGGEVTYALDAAGNIDVEKTFDNGTLASTVDYDYAGNRLVAQSVNGAPSARYLYDAEGNLDCVTTAAFTGASCLGAESSLVSDYTYDYLNRLLAFRSFSTTGAAEAEASYVYDALDRLVRQSQSHAGSTPRTTSLAYLGLTPLVSSEEQSEGGSKITDKTYAYDAYGHRIAMTNAPAAPSAGGKAGTFTYGYDVHGSVSLLLDEAGTATASYGYKPYGADDPGLTDEPEEGGTSSDNPLNGYRYSGKRLDTGSGTLDMGARRFGPDTSRFLQQDHFSNVLSDVALSVDPITQNRYSLAGGNPISFVEWDGHVAVPESGGGGAPATERPSTLGSSLAKEIMGEDSSAPPQPRGPAAVGAGMEHARELLLTSDADMGPTAGSALAREMLLGADGGPTAPTLPATFGNGSVTCQDMPNGTAKDYLSGRACPPPGFPYDPIVKMVDGVPLALDPFNDGCSGISGSGVADHGKDFDFTDGCVMHDYGYDLKRWGGVSFKREDVDRQLLDAMYRHCDERHDFFSRGRWACKGRAKIYDQGIDVATTWFGDYVSGYVETEPGPNTDVTWLP